MQTDEWLRHEVDKVKSGDQEALTNFISSVSPLLRRTITRSIQHLTPTERDDLMQEALLRILQSLNTLSDSDKVSSSCIAITKNVCSEFKRERRKRDSVTVLEKAASVEEGQPGSKTKMEHHLLMESIGQAMSELSDRDRAIFWYYYRQGMTAREIARIVDLTEKGVESTLLRVTRIVRSALVTKGP